MNNSQNSTVNVNEVFAIIDYVCSQSLVKRQDHDSAIFGIESLKNTYTVHKKTIHDLETENKALKEKLADMELLLSTKK